MDIAIAGPAGTLDVRVKGLTSGTPVVILVQGANLSGQLGYDFQFSGGQDYSMMDALATRGIASVTFAIRGYRKSTLTGDPMDLRTEHAIEDLGAVIDWLKSQGIRRPHLAGWSWGGRISARYAQQQGDRIDRLVLLDPAFGGGNKILPPPTDPWWSNSRDYFFERLEAEFTELAAREALADQVSRFEPKSPNGIRMENALGSTPPDPTAIANPTLLLYGEAAGHQNYMQGSVNRTDFFEGLSTGDKMLAIVPGGGDYAHLQNPRRHIHRVVADFLLTSR